MEHLSKRATVYLAPTLHRALKLKAMETERTLSELVNDAVKTVLSEDADDLAAFRERALEPRISFEKVLKDLKKHGRL